MVGLAACNTPNLSEPSPSIQRPTAQAPLDNSALRAAPTTDSLGRLFPASTVRVAILVPLTGDGASAGTALLRAAQMAVLDNAPGNFVLLPFDTGGTPQGAGLAADQALAAGADLIIGPLFSRSVGQVAARAAPYNVNVISFSNDARVAGNNALVMGVLPSGQVDRILSYAAGQGLDDIAVLAPANEYGQAITDAARLAAARYNIRLANIQLVDPRATFDPIIATLAEEPFLEAALVAEGGLRLREASGFFGFYELNEVQLLGTTLWEDPSVMVEPTLAGGWYPSTDPAGHASFISQYQEAFGETPPGVAALAYDAASLAGSLARDFGPDRFGRTALLNPSGFAGIEGVFRFTADGTVERGLAVMEVQPQGAQLRDQAPTTFATAGF